MDESALIESLGNDFVQDLIDIRLSCFHNLILEFEKENGNGDSEIYEELFRRFHGAKGTGGVFGMYCVSTVFHQLESYLALFSSEHKFDRVATFTKMHDELDLIEKMAQAWLIGERDLRGFIIEHEASEQAKKTALILEPLKSVSDQVMAVLHDNGYEPLLVFDGVQAIQHLVTKSYDLFITSEQNRFINGSELIGFIKVTPRLSKIKVIYLSTDSDYKGQTYAPDMILKKDSLLLKALDIAVK